MTGKRISVSMSSGKANGASCIFTSKDGDSERLGNLVGYALNSIEAHVTGGQSLSEFLIGLRETVNESWREEPTDEPTDEP